MHPYLFDWVVGGHHLRPPSYGVMLALGFSLGYFEALRRAAKLGENPRHIENLFLMLVLGTVVGARLFHVVFEEFPYYLAHPAKIFAVWEGGYTFYGGLVTALFFMYLYCRRKKLDYLQFMDIAAPSTAIGLFMGRLGCFFAGCCWGRPTTVPWAVTFSNPESFTSVHHLTVHPTQLYEAFGAVAVLIYLQWRFSRRRYLGQLFFHGLIAYAVLRFLVEFFRGDDYRGFIFGHTLSYAQFVSLMIFPLAVVGMFLYSRVKKRNG
ncbi:MAG: prolipoprotein diacylglyceryl transferase [Deltaproteobacteria bacterium]|nr:prolipoprotein diacylglyceryl transferase [Deltaproteobacteria bacterium]